MCVITLHCIHSAELHESSSVLRLWVRVVVAIISCVMSVGLGDAAAASPGHLILPVWLRGRWLLQVSSPGVRLGAYTHFIFFHILGLQ